MICLDGQDRSKYQAHDVTVDKLLVPKGTKNVEMEKMCGFDLMMLDVSFQVCRRNLRILNPRLDDFALWFLVSKSQSPHPKSRGFSFHFISLFCSVGVHVGESK